MILRSAPTEKLDLQVFIAKEVSNFCLFKSLFLSKA